MPFFSIRIETIPAWLQPQVSLCTQLTECNKCDKLPPVKLEVAMTIMLGAREARKNFSELLGRVGYGGEVAIVERSGKPMVAVIPVALYEQLVAEREVRFQVMDRIRNRAPDLPVEEVEADISRAIGAIRPDQGTKP
jgi:prevent-host-death family protein